ncbi:MAG: ATP-binding protein [Desulfamplus sp.]|nr:ATP-binding protein [Desulfamplus sp.]
MKPINTSNSTFSTFIEEGCLYVDKTAHLRRVIGDISGQYFLARPRRFGKSLMISTLRSIFEGKRELFKGLAIDTLDYDWQTFPVIHLNMGSCVGSTIAELRRNLMDLLSTCARDLELKLADDEYEVVAFRNLILDAERKYGPAVVLVDEYDKPLLGHLGKESAKSIQELLKSFYSVIKTTEDKQRFAMITGVSKFSKVSIFSDLNNLTDLSMQRDSATLLGYTQEELESNFADYITRLTKTLDLKRKQVIEEIREWYNGYRFEENAPTIYNPVSVMKCLVEQKFCNFWFETGTPTFLIDLLKRQPMEPGGDLTVPASAFSAYEPEQLQVLPLLVQTGYLTITGSRSFGGKTVYHLGYPNREVDLSFTEILAKGLGGIDDLELNNSLMGVVKTLRQGDIDALLTHLKVFFKGIPYDIQLSQEKYYQTIFFVIFRMLNTEVEAESRSASGRVDAILKTPERIVLLEFKLHDSAETALKQIKSKEYSLQYQDDGRKLIRVGVAFDQKTRNLGEWLIEE